MRDLARQSYTAARLSSPPTASCWNAGCPIQRIFPSLTMKLRHLFSAPCLAAALLLLPMAVNAAPTAPNKAQRAIVITMPAETVLASLQKMLPLAIPSHNEQLQGDIVLESLDRLFIHDNILSLRGVLSGKNLVIITNIAGQDLRLKLGQIHLPVTCDLQTRFDQAKRKLFVTPRFAETVADKNSQEASVGSLIGALGGREYPVDLDALQLLNIKMGTRSIPIAMEPTNIAGTDNALIFRLMPRIGEPTEHSTR